MTVQDLRKILRGVPAEAEVTLAHHDQHVAFVGYSVDRGPDGEASRLTLKTAAREQHATK
jgi:hypothetical protein